MSIEGGLLKFGYRAFRAFEGEDSSHPGEMTKTAGNGLVFLKHLTNIL